MYERFLIVPDSLRNVRRDGDVVGFEFDVRIGYYRGVRLAMVEEIEVTVDGEVIPRERRRFAVGGRSFSFEEMEAVTDVRWEFGDAATIFVERPAGLDAGTHVIEVSEAIRIAYASGYARARASKELTLLEESGARCGLTGWGRLPPGLLDGAARRRHQDRLSVVVRMRVRSGGSSGPIAVGSSTDSRSGRCSSPSHTTTNTIAQSKAPSRNAGWSAAASWWRCTEGSRWSTVRCPRRPAGRPWFTITPNSVTPMVVPIARENWIIEVAEPSDCGGTELCAAIVNVCIIRPDPTPRMTMNTRDLDLRRAGTHRREQEHPQSEQHRAQQRVAAVAAGPRDPLPDEDRRCDGAERLRHHHHAR